jgi:hypothetical protein
MTCYLDPIIPCHIKTRAGYVDGCVMWADEEGELEAVAVRAGIPLAWKQRSVSGMAFFNISIPYRCKARAAGAVCLSEREAGRMHRERWAVRKQAPKKLQLVRA